MKPAAFDYVRAGSLADAAKVLADAGGAAKAIAGGQSLGPMLNLRLAQPRLLVDLTAIAELTASAEAPDALTLGACVTTADIEDRRIPLGGLPMLAEVAGGIAYRAVRNRGTIGGSVCHADPAADWPAALAALGAECIVFDGRGTRRIAVDQFTAGAFEVALAPGELLQAIRIPRPSRSARWGYVKICRKPGEFALAIGAVLSDPDRGVFRAVIGATQGRPIVIPDAGAIFAQAGAVNEAEVHRRLDAAGHARGPARRLFLTALARAGAKAGIA
jgi:carbon-monoxide dehydrogenase medium subunit